MKKLAGCILIIVAGFFLVNACKKKESSTKSTGDGLAACPNTKLNVAGSNWTVTPYTSNPTTITAQYNSTDITIILGTSPPIGMTQSYTITGGNPGPNQARLIISNAPGQLATDKFYPGPSNIIKIDHTSTFTHLTFNNIVCYPYQNPNDCGMITTSGDITCQ